MTRITYECHKYKFVKFVSIREIGVDYKTLLNKTKDCDTINLV